MESHGQVRTSMILVAVGGRVETYPSIEDLPPELRQKLVESTSGEATATLLIADRAGRDAILRSIRAKPRPRAGWFRTWGAILLAGAAGLTVWLLATYR